MARAARLATLQKGAVPNASIDAFRQPDAAELLNVSRPSVQRGRTALSNAIPELVKAVYQGSVADSAAAPDALQRLNALVPVPRH